MYNYESLVVWIEVTLFDCLGLTWNYVAQIFLGFFASPKGKLGLDVGEVHHPFCAIFY